MPRVNRKLQKRISLTPIVDVVFVLLMFFMLTTVFTENSQVEFFASRAPQPDQDRQKTPTFFMRLSETGLTLNGYETPMPDLAQSSLSKARPGSRIMISLKGDVEIQRLLNLFVVLRQFPDLSIVMLES